MRLGTVVYKGTSRKGKPFLVRYPKASDASAMRDYINTLSRERSFILFQGEQMSLVEEKKHLAARLQEIKNRSAVTLLVFSGKKLIGNSGISLKRRAERHVGGFGISIAKSFRGEGVGKTLMRLVLKEAKKNLSGLKIVELGVYANNPRAIKMYRKFGFKKFGALPKGVLRRGKYVDHVFMYRKV